MQLKQANASSEVVLEGHTSSLLGGSFCSSGGSGDHSAKYGSSANMPAAKDSATNGAAGTCTCKSSDVRMRAADPGADKLDGMLPRLSCKHVGQLNPHCCGSWQPAAGEPHRWLDTRLAQREIKVAQLLRMQVNLGQCRAGR